MSHPLDGARERLKRADEHIRNLNKEIDDFFAPVPKIEFTCEARDPIFTDRDRRSFEELRHFISTSEVDPRFRVLVGEIIHHLRSAFDHVAWELSSLQFQTDFPERIEFPVLKARLCSIAEKKSCRHCRKIKGISSPTALARIETLQPYTVSNPDRHPLWLIHDLDRKDKHRELTLTVYILRVNLTGNTLVNALVRQMPWERTPRIAKVLGVSNVTVNGTMSAQITLGEFTGREDEPIIPTLKKLLSFTTDAIESFAEEFR